MTAVELLQAASWALFLLLALVAILDAIRRPRRASIDTALFFGVAALTILAASLGGAAHLSSRIQSALSGSFVMALPYLLVRLVDDFADLPPLVPSFALAGLVFAVAALFALPAPLPGIVTLLLVLYFIGLTTYASLVVVQEARRARGVTRRRLEAMAAGSLFLGLTILWAGLQALAPHESDVWAVLSQLSGIASGIAYYLGVATPGVLRRAWQTPAVRAFLSTAASLQPGGDFAAGIRALEEGVAVALGASQAAIGQWDEQRGVLRYHGTDAGPGPELRPGAMVSGRAFAEQRPIFAEDVTGEGEPGAARYRAAGIAAVLAAPITAGTRNVGVMAAYAARAPLFAADDLALLEILAQVTAVILDYARAYEAAVAGARAERERERLRQIMDVIPEAVLVVDARGRVVTCNAAALAITGRERPREVQVGEYDALIRHPDGTPYAQGEAPLARSLLRGEVVRGEQVLVIRGPSTPPIPILFSSAPLRDVDGAVTGAVAVYQDISELRRVEQEKDAFLSSVSHDLKNPLMAMTGHVQLLRRRLQRTGTLRPDQLAMGFDAIESATEQLTQLVNQILDVSRLQMGRKLDLEPTPVDLVAMVRRLVDTYQGATERHRLVVETGAAEIVGEWDAQRVERVFANLLGNAVKYSPEGGTIAVAVCRRDDGGVAWAEVSVRDEGVGIPAVDAARIFDRFYRASNVSGRIAGSGIGLAGAKQIVEQHGGTIAVESNEGAGSTFTVRLPIAPPQAGVALESSTGDACRESTTGG